MANFVYMIECEDGSFYTGYTTDLVRRFKAHLSGRGAKYTRSHKPVRVVWYTEVPTKSDALRLEHDIKQLTHDQKEWLIEVDGVVEHCGSCSSRYVEWWMGEACGN